MSSLLRPQIYRRCHQNKPLHIAADKIQQWAQSVSSKQLTVSQTLSSDHISDLYVTLPTRDGTASPRQLPGDGQNLGYGHHLVFFHARNPERDLRWDGTDADFCPPEPYTRRMWAGGRMVWKKPLVIGQKAVSTSTVGSVEHKGLEKGSPMVFVRQKIAIQQAGSDEVCIEEERTHVYLPTTTGKRASRPKLAEKLPPSSFSFTYTPSPTTLFRFSALTFNGHYIHLDKDYAQQREGYPERLVHGPLTALMMLETATMYKQGAQFLDFEYRAVSPLVVGQPITLQVAENGNTTMRLWAEGADGVVGMTGTLLYA
ncbi:Thioesterase/thiol ester dehydrase-isomerase [Gloeophyllum trabeum ATCC 11539]|uniref:Thioesterase/thiol ester dehydrase-isomerase n=1 Tax=Gloeophyllum trabeum (strain ATCC 11539 / FP-39264 / Madison 617) TaxID=670483 RepID=S7QGF8_GLOTA|nr:Thioesterase/thiol ester dehydrase-isomerase [Gloeophyllum trabeum ATCC 11539]EPQ58273.1 Thioesterase/thiol ester dehydrase-isomerase [Gloeophyllum trabeum ATCC 11539]